MTRHGSIAVAVALALALGAGACASGGSDEAALVREVATTSSALPATTTSTIAPPAAEPAPTTGATGARLAADLAAELDAAEAALAAPASSPADVVAWAHRQQVAYRRLAAHPQLIPSVVAAVAPAVRPAVRANVEAERSLRSLLRVLPTELPVWRIVTPRPAGELRRYYAEAEARYGVPWAYLAAINLVETRMGRVRGTSVAGAQGPMQFMPATWDAYGDGDVHDDHDAIMGAAHYLAANGAPDRMDDALWHYNHSAHYVAAITAYAERMLGNGRAFAAYHAWQVWYRTAGGDVLLPEGWQHPTLR